MQTARADVIGVLSQLQKMENEKMINSESSQVEISSRMIRFLIHGVGNDCKRFADACRRVLLSLGITARDDIRHMVGRANLRRPHARRMSALIPKINDLPDTQVNPVPGVFRALLTLIEKSDDDVDVYRAVHAVADLVGRQTVARVLMDELCGCHEEIWFIYRLISAMGYIPDAFSPSNHDLLRWIVFDGHDEMPWVNRKRVHWVAELPPDSFDLPDDGRDAGCCGLKLLDWLECAVLVGPYSHVTNPEWIRLREFRYRPRQVSDCCGPMDSGPIESSVVADCHPAPVTSV